MKHAGRRPFNKHRTITQGNNASDEGDVYAYNLGILPMPDHLDAEEAAVWDDVLQQAPKGALTSSSHYILEMFCYQICQIRQIRAEMKLLKEVKHDKQKAGEKTGKGSKATTATTSLTILHNGRVAPNPLLTAYRSAVATASQLSNTLGLTGGKRRSTVQDDEEQNARDLAAGKGKGLHSVRQGLIGGMVDDGAGDHDVVKEEDDAPAPSRGSRKAKSTRSR